MVVKLHELSSLELPLHVLGFSSSKKFRWRGDLQEGNMATHFIFTKRGFYNFSEINDIHTAKNVIDSTVCLCVHQRRHQSSALSAHLGGIPPVTGGFPSKAPAAVELHIARHLGCHAIMRFIRICESVRCNGDLAYACRVNHKSNETTRCSVENEDVVGAAPTGDSPTSSE